MPTYHYSARDVAGRSSNGVAVADSEATLRRQLREQDLFLIDAKVGGQSGGTAQTSLFAGKITLQDRIIAIRQLSTFLRAGVPLNQGLEIIAQQTTKPELIKAWTEIRQGINAGESLSHGLKKYPKIFTTLVTSLVEAGETSGTLEETLEVAAIQLDREDALRRKIKAAMFYPKLVVFASIGTVAMMLLLVVPVFADVYKTLRAELPFATQALITMSNALTRAWWVIAIVGFVVWFAFKKFRETEKGTYIFDRLALKAPIVGILNRKIAIARTTETLAGALKGGVPIIRSLEISASTAGNVIIRDAVLTVTESVKAGAGVGPEMAKTGEFPLMVTKMIEAGEQSGNIDSMLYEINRFYEQDVQYEVDKLTRAIEPLMTIVVGVIVLFVLLALYMPVFNLGSAFQSKSK